MASLYERLGGEPAVSLVVDKFYQNIMQDDRLKGFFKNTDMPKQIQQQKNFITLVTGGPNNYHGRDMKQAHQKLGIGKVEFDATWGCLQSAMKHYNVAEELINELKEIFYSVEQDVEQKQ